MNVLVNVSGSISAYKTCEVVSRVLKMGHKVRVCASKASLNFVGASTWEGLTGERVFLDDFSPGQRMDHIHLNTWADVTLLSPASAKTLNQISQGVGDGVINTLFLARDLEKPFLIFPAMNPKMYNCTQTTSSLERLESQKNVHVYGPNKGLMACGDSGSGRLLEPHEIVDALLNYLPFTKRVLVTFGGTAESLDGVREISNFSTGETGLRLVEELSKKYLVTALYSSRIKRNFSAAVKKTFVSSFDLERALKEELESKDYDAIFHLSAVSDYIFSDKSNQKIDSSENEINLKLVKRGKILNQVRSWSKNKSIKLISFKLTHNQDSKVIYDKIMTQLKNSHSDFVVHNSLNDSRGERHVYEVFDSRCDRPIFVGDTKESLVRDLAQILSEESEALSC